MSDDDAYRTELVQLQLALIALQQDAIETGRKLLVVFEGRDAAGKDGTISRITEHLSLRATRVVALPKPSEKERGQWFLQRYAAQLPAAGELVLFNRSWYNRAGVEKVMGFSTPIEQAQFLKDAPQFECMLVAAGIPLVKFWLDISKKEQAVRLKDRRTDPLKAFKTSPLDEVAQQKWDDYTDARDAMLIATHTREAPWVCVRADHKEAARLNVMRWVLHALAPKSISRDVNEPDPEVIFPFEPAALTDGRLAR